MRGATHTTHTTQPPPTVQPYKQWHRRQQLQILQEACLLMHRTCAKTLGTLNTMSSNIYRLMDTESPDGAINCLPSSPVPIAPPGGTLPAWARHLEDRKQHYDSANATTVPLSAPEDPPLGVRQGYTPPAWLKEAGFNVIWRAEGDWWAATGPTPWTGTSVCLNHLNFVPPDLPAYTQPKFTVIKL